MIEEQTILNDIIYTNLKNIDKIYNILIAGIKNSNERKLVPTFKNLILKNELKRRIFQSLLYLPENIDKEEIYNHLENFKQELELEYDDLDYPERNIDRENYTYQLDKAIHEVIPVADQIIDRLDFI